MVININKKGYGIKCPECNSILSVKDALLNTYHVPGVIGYVTAGFECIVCNHTFETDLPESIIG